MKLGGILFLDLWPLSRTMDQYKMQTLRTCHGLKSKCRWLHGINSKTSFTVAKSTSRVMHNNALDRTATA